MWSAVQPTKHLKQAVQEEGGHLQSIDEPLLVEVRTLHEPHGF